MFLFNLDENQALVSVSPHDFVAFWEERYPEAEYSTEDYERYLNVRGLLSDENVRSLIDWKFKFLPQEERQSLVSTVAPKVKQRLKQFNEFRLMDYVSDFAFGRFWELSWRLAGEVGLRFVLATYLLHIPRPWDYPMVDRHVLRTRHFITTGQIRKDPLENLADEQALNVFQAYRNFFAKFVFESHSGPREVDKAFWSFGKLLNEPKAQFLPKQAIGS